MDFSDAYNTTADNANRLIDALAEDRDRVVTVTLTARQVIAILGTVARDSQALIVEHAIGCALGQFDDDAHAAMAAKIYCSVEAVNAIIAAAESVPDTVPESWAS